MGPIALLLAFPGVILYVLIQQIVDLVRYGLMGIIVILLVCAILALIDVNTGAKKRPQGERRFLLYERYSSHAFASSG